MRRGHWGRWIALGTVLAVLVGGAAVWYFVFRDTAPDTVSIDAAGRTAEEAGTSSAGSTSTTSSGTGRTSGALDGTWKVDQSVGDFDVSSNTFTSAFVGYRVNEQLAGVGAKTAYGRTPEVTGSMTIDGTTVTDATFTADLTTLQSDDARRDGQLRNQGIQTGTFPNGTFKLTEPIDFGAVPTDQSTVTVDATGDLTLHGVTKSVTIPLEAKLVNGRIVVTSLFEIAFADFGIQKPVAGAVLSIEDKGQMEVQLYFARA